MQKGSKHSKYVGQRYRHSKTVHSGNYFNSNSTHKYNKKIKKEHLRSSHSNSSKINTKKINIKKILVCIIIILVLIFGIVEITSYFHPKAENTETNIKEINLDMSKKIEGLDNIEVNGIKIQQNDATANINIKFKNITNNIQQPFESHLSILNTEGYVLFGLQCSIPEISANSEIDYSIITNDDLTTAGNYRFVNN